MKKIEGLEEYVSASYTTMSDREIAKAYGASYSLVFNIRKRLSLERSAEFNHSRRVLSGIKGGTSTQKNKRYGQDSGNWRGGRSTDHMYYLRRQKAKFPEKFAARRMAIKARMRGDIIMQPCILCGEQKTHAHHEDYSKPLSIVWLCQKHHLGLHNNQLLDNEIAIVKDVFALSCAVS